MPAGAPRADVFQRDARLGHTLAPHYAALRAIRTRRKLESSALWAAIAGDVARVLDGTAILSKLPIARVVNADLPELRDKFSSSEKRLGKKRALVAELDAGAPLVVACGHLDSNASPAQRALQLGALLACAESFGRERVLVGGDFNTTTYDL